MEEELKQENLVFLCPKILVYKISFNKFFNSFVVFLSIFIPISSIFLTIKLELFFVLKDFSISLIKFFLKNFF